jgi:hypothetical protein
VEGSVALEEVCLAVEVPADAGRIFFRSDIIFIWIHIALQLILMNNTPAFLEDLLPVL